MLSFFKQTKNKFKKCIEIDDVDGVVKYYKDKSVDIESNFIDYVELSYHHNSINVFQFLIQKNRLSKHTDKKLYEFITGLYENTNLKNHLFIEILYDNNYFITRQKRRSKFDIRRNVSFSKAMLLFSITNYNTIIFDLLMKSSTNLNLNPNELFEYAYENNQAFLKHLFQYKELTKKFKSIYPLQFNNYNKFVCGEKIRYF